MGNIISKFISVWVRPWSAMESVKTDTSDSLKPSIVFIVAMGLLSGLITAIVGTILPPANVAAGAASKAVVWMAVVVVPIVSLIGSFIGAVIIWGLVYGLLMGTGSQYKAAYRLLALLAAFSPVSALLSPIPGVGAYLAIAINIWATIVMIRGIIMVMNTSPLRTWLTCGILFAFLFLLGIFARAAAQRQFQAGVPAIPGLEAGGDFGATGVDQQLENLANQAKTDAGTTKQ